MATIKRVQGQVEHFRAEMLQDGQAQRRQARKTISNATKAAQKLVEDTLQVGLFVRSALTTSCCETKAFQNFRPPMKLCDGNTLELGQM